MVEGGGPNWDIPGVGSENRSKGTEVDGIEKNRAPEINRQPEKSPSEAGQPTKLRPQAPTIVSRESKANRPQVLPAQPQASQQLPENVGHEGAQAALISHTRTNPPRTGDDAHRIVLARQKLMNR